MRPIALPISLLPTYSMSIKRIENIIWKASSYIQVHLQFSGLYVQPFAESQYLSSKINTNGARKRSKLIGNEVSHILAIENANLQAKRLCKIIPKDTKSVETHSLSTQYHPLVE